MRLINLLFSPYGTESRLPYFLGSLCISVVMIVALFASLVMIFAGAMSSEALLGIGILLLGVMPVVLYSSVVLMMKRLRDLGYSPWNTVWIILLAFVGSALNEWPHFAVQAAGLFVSLVLLVIQACLLFMPGQSHQKVSSVFE